MPTLFVGHGSPMNAVLDNVWTRAQASLAEGLPRPRAILAVSAHWYVAGTFVTANAQPETLHDFGGFPRALYDIRYGARGDVELARRISQLVADPERALSLDWGLDHGTWSVLVHMWPKADVPVLQLSIDRRLAPNQHLALGRALAPLRDEGVLILGSGNVTHNLRHALGQMHLEQPATPAWATDFDAELVKILEQRDAPALTRMLESDHGRLAHPTPDHFLPLLYAVGAATRDDAVTFPSRGFDLGSISMRSVRLG